MDFHKEMERYTQEAEQIIRRYLPENTGEAIQLKEAMDYSLLAGGKRLRPLMMLMSYEMFGGRSRLIFPFMAAMEMIHTQSLVHDDLPAMDNDEYRRGRKTTHVVFGEAAAILAGDGLLNLAYETVGRSMAEYACMCPENSGCTKELRNAARAFAVLAEKTGIYGMIGGQSVDVKMDGKPLDKDLLDFIYRLKTGALIEASLMIGAILAGASETEISVLEQIGQKIGIAFQIRDDILDETGDEKELGKPIHSDLKNEKTTYVTLYGLEKADSDVKKLTEEAMQLLKGLGKEHPLLGDLLLSLTQRKK